MILTRFIYLTENTTRFTSIIADELMWVVVVLDRTDSGLSIGKGPLIMKEFEAIVIDGVTVLLFSKWCVHGTEMVVRRWIPTKFSLVLLLLL